MKVDNSLRTAGVVGVVGLTVRVKMRSTVKMFSGRLALEMINVKVN